MISDEIRKQKLCVTVSPKLKKRVTEEWETRGFSSASDMVNTVLVEYFTRDDVRKENEKR